MIICIRGTHGSGKSHIVRCLLKRYKAVPESTDSKGRPNNYVMTMSNGAKLYVVGNYTNACGGCDGIQPYSEIWPRVERFAKHGHVVFEGALVSSSYGNIGRSSEQYGDEFVFAFLDTPLHTCLDRVRQRRESRGNFAPLDPKNTEVKYNNILKSLPKIRDEFKRRVVMLEHKRAVPQLVGLLYHG